MDTITSAFALALLGWGARFGAKELRKQIPPPIKESTFEDLMCEDFYIPPGGVAGVVVPLNYFCGEPVAPTNSDDQDPGPSTGGDTPPPTTSTLPIYS